MKTDPLEVPQSQTDKSVEGQLKLETVELVPEFKDRLKKHYEVLNGIYENEKNKKKFGLGPKYQTKTSMDEEISVETLTFDELPGQRDYRLFVEDSSDRIIAEAYFTVDNMNPSHAYVWNLDIMTGVRDRGVGSSLVSTCEKLLQLEANRIGHQLNVPVSDHNVVDLNNIEQRLRDDPDNKILQEQHTEKLAERARWEASVGKRKSVFIPEDYSHDVDDSLANVTALKDEVDSDNDKILHLLDKIKNTLSI